MPKRRNSDDCEHISKKIKKLERKLKHARKRQRKSSSSEGTSSGENNNNILDSPLRPDIDDISQETIIIPEETVTHELTPIIESNSADPPDIADEGDGKLGSTELDPDLLEILGVDPSATIVYGTNIQGELATRLEHVATTGLEKSTRKELNDRYLIPANCVKIGAPSMNAEIKAAVTEVVIKRDKGIEMRQKQLAAAISGLASLLSSELESKDKDNSQLKLLMDVCRILCDIQHSESVIRRNFGIFSIKKELKDHLTNSKIDKLLFGEDLAETLRTAKAVNKSGVELKTKPLQKPKTYSSSNHLNWKSQAPARGQRGPARGRVPATSSMKTPPARNYRSAPPASSSKTSYYPPRQSRRN